jgi:hypothetical protein
VAKEEKKEANFYVRRKQKKLLWVKKLTMFLMQRALILGLLPLETAWEG